MKFKIDSKIFDQHPDLKIGALVIKGIDNSKRVSSVEGLLRGICAQRRKEFAEKDMYEDEMIRPWAAAYGKFGINPKKNAPSIAALLKRVSLGKEIPHINVLVDIYNYFSLKYLLPVGGEDMDWLAGDLQLKFTEGREAFRPLGSIDVEEAAEGEVAYMDEGGITCRYWNYRECERTKFTPKTVNALVFIEDLSKMHMDKFGQILEEMAEMIAKYIGGAIEPHILNEENLEINLGIEGRKTANDARISQQEKAFFQGMSQLKKNSKSAPVKKPKKLSKALDLEDKSLLKSRLTVVVEKAIKAAFPKLKKTEIELEYPSSADHGDYACNVALRLTKELGKSPQDIAKEIISKLNDPELIAKAETAGPGFINIFVADELLQSEIDTVLEKKDKYGSLKIGKEKNIILDYSAPNIAKPLGVHHLMSTIIGQTLNNIFVNLGFKTIGINHLGDWGTQFGKLIYAYKKWGDKKVVEKDPITELQKLYVKFHEEVEDNPKLEDEGRAEFRKFEKGDKENHELWKWFVDESMKEIEKTYAKLGGIKFDYNHGESFYEDKMESIIEEGKKLKIFEKGEEGAYVVQYEDPNIAPFVVLKKDGATLYSTRDFATLKYRIDTWAPAQILYIVDIAQTMHFKQLFTASERFPWYDGGAMHVWFGRMHMKDGKMSTRKGNVILLNEVLAEAEKRALKIVTEKSPDLAGKEAVAHAIGIGAIKYNVLSQNRTSDITFDWDNMLSFDGNSSPYLQYSYARGKSILRRAGEEQKDKITDPKTVEEKTRQLLRLFPKFSEQLTLAAKEYKPNVLCNYLYDLAQTFNSFYNTVPVLKAEEGKEDRLRIVEATTQILKNGLAILGIEVVEEM